MDAYGYTCDRCPATAKVRATYDTGGCIYACQHHANEWWPETGVYTGVTFDYAPIEVPA
jgi:hypothetical protein